MKFIIADDELIVREGLKNLIDWSALGFTLCDEASDGTEAVEKILAQNPELVILDIKMPELNGVEVAAAIRKEGYTGKIIVLSGYSDFSYAQAAIRFGVDSYLLKPVEETELIAILETLRDKIEQENILEAYNSQSVSNAKKMMLRHILTDSVPGTVQNFESLGLSFQTRPFYLITIDYSHYQSLDMESLCDFWSRLCPDKMTEYLVMEYSVVLLMKGARSMDYFTSRLSAFIEKVSRETLLEPFVIISEAFDEIKEYSKVHQLHRHIIARRFFYYEEKIPLFCKSLSETEAIPLTETTNPIEFIENIYQAILDKDASLIRATMNKLYHVLQTKNYSVEQAYQILINCVLQLKELLNTTYIKELLELDVTDLIHDICGLNTLSEIMRLLSGKFLLFSEYIKKSSEISTAEKVLNYLDSHYCEDIKLEKISELFSYNPAYLGKLLTSQVGMGFNLYIEKKRMDRAIDLLVNTEIKIPEISALIGYRNTEYFYRRFKKYTGYTPGSYRALHQSS